MKSFIAYLVLVSCGIVAEAEEPVAILPYRALYEMIPKENRIESQTIRAQIRSQKPGVASKDIRLRLVYGNSERVLELDETGCMNLPIDGNLVTKNASIVSNQPKGTLVISGFLASDADLGIVNGTSTYRKLMRLAKAQYDKARALEKEGLIKGIKESDCPIRLRSEKYADFRVIIRDQDRPETIASDGHHTVTILLGMKFWETNPEVQFEPADSIENTPAQPAAK